MSENTLIHTSCDKRLFFSKDGHTVEYHVIYISQ